MSIVASRVKSIIAEQLGISDDEITSDSSFIEDLGADSLDLVEVVMAIEEEYPVEISQADADNLEKVEDLINYIETNLH